VQSLFMSPEFRNQIYDYQRPENMSDEDAVQCIPYQLQKLFIQLQFVLAPPPDRNTWTRLR
jgi:hypothetical protein